MVRSMHALQLRVQSVAVCDSQDLDLYSSPSSVKVTGRLGNHFSLADLGM